MTLYNFEAINATPSASDTLKVLSDAISGKTAPPEGRVLAASERRSPEEGLALLAAYVAIDDAKIRQAFLDALFIVSASPKR